MWAFMFGLKPKHKSPHNHKVKRQNENFMKIKKKLVIKKSY